MLIIPDKENHIVINPRGEIYKCTARDYTKNNVEGQMKSSGVIDWYPIHKERLETSVLNYEKCLQCKILPICNAGCSQKKIENPLGFCPCDYNEKIKEKYALKVLLESLEF